MFENLEKRDQLRSRVGGEVIEIGELLLCMREATNEQEMEKRQLEKAAREVDAENDRFGS